MEIKVFLDETTGKTQSYIPTNTDQTKRQRIDINDLVIDSSFEKDIYLIMTETGCTRERAIDSFYRHEGDLVNIILELTENFTNWVWKYHNAVRKL